MDEDHVAPAEEHLEEALERTDDAEVGHHIRSAQQYLVVLSEERENPEAVVLPI